MVWFIPRNHGRQAKGSNAVAAEDRRIFHLALRDRHIELGASMELFGSWMLPMNYGDTRREYRAIREAAAIFDRSHHSRFIVSGTDAGDVLQRCFGDQVSGLEEGRAARVVSLNEAGHIRELATLARTGGISYLVVGEPGQRFETERNLAAAVDPDFDVRVDDRTETTCLLGIAGPAAAGLVQEHLAEGLPARMPAMHTAMFELHGFRTLAVRTSGLGEDGFELMLAPAVMLHLIDSLLASGAVLAGMEAQEQCRVEACIPAFDPDLAPGLTPGEADIDTLLGISGEGGKQALSPLLLDGNPVPVGEPVEHGGVIVGQVRSSVWSPALDAAIALAVLDQDHALPGTRCAVRGQSAVVVAKPILRRRPAPS